MIRKLKRNLLKNEIGSNKIQLSWRAAQIETWGKPIWVKKFNCCNRKKGSPIKATTENAYLV